MREMETKKRTANQLVHPAIGLIRGRSSTSRRQVLAANTNPTHSRNPCSRQILSTQPEHPRDALCSVLSDLRTEDPRATFLASGDADSARLPDYFFGELFPYVSRLGHIADRQTADGAMAGLPSNESIISA